MIEDVKTSGRNVSGITTPGVNVHDAAISCCVGPTSAGQNVDELRRPTDA